MIKKHSQQLSEGEISHDHTKELYPGQTDISWVEMEVPEVSEQPQEMVQANIVPMLPPWDPVMLSLVVDKRTGLMSFSNQGLRNSEDVRLLILGIHRAQELATDLLLQITQYEHEHPPDEKTT